MSLTIPRTITNNKLLLTLALSLLIHLAALTPLSLPIADPNKTVRPIAITLTQVRSQEATNLPSQLPSIVKKIASTTSFTPLKHPLSTVEKTNSAHRPTPSTPKPLPKQPSRKKPRQNLSVNTLVQQISDMGRTIRQKTLNPKNNRIKFSNSLSQSHQHKAIYYIKQWQAKVARIGNLNYPAIAQTPGFRGTLLIDAGINPDGSLYSIRVRQSSGIDALDEAAIKIVRMGAPYAPLPKELLDEIDVLVISRVWQFSDETGISTSQ